MGSAANLGWALWALGLYGIVWYTVKGFQKNQIRGSVLRACTVWIIDIYSLSHRRRRDRQMVHNRYVLRSSLAANIRGP